MTPPIRPEIFALCTWGEEEMRTLRIRDVADWYKRVLAAPGITTDLEASYLDKYYAALVRGVALREGVPEGWLSYSLAQLSQGEARLLSTVSREYDEAMEPLPHG